jgi:apolipoprotein N-acyltransferase
MRGKVSGWAIGAVGVAASAAAFYVSTGLGEFWPAAWIAPAPVLLYAARARPRSAMLMGLAAYLLGSLNLFTYLTRVIPPALVLLLLLVPALAFGAAVLAHRAANRRLRPWTATLVFPAAWASWEFLLSLASPHGTFGSLAYSQADVLPVVQMASITGVPGVTFVLAIVPAAIATAYTRRSWRALAPAAAILALVLAYGHWRLRAMSPGSSVRIGLAATDRGIGEAVDATDASLAVAVAQAYADRVARLGRMGARVIVLLEKLVGVTPADSDQVLSVFRQAARSSGVTLIAGLNRIGVTPRRNVALVIAPDGSIITEYDKHHLLPGPETGYESGARPGIFAASGANWGVAICKDMDFPAWLRRYGAAGITILAAPAWDFVRDGRLHSRMAVFRGVENGFAMARAAQQGLLTLSDGYGRVIAEKSTTGAPEAMLVGDVPRGPGPTPYTRFGDWFGWLSVLLFLALLAGAAVAPPAAVRSKSAGA